MSDDEIRELRECFANAGSATKAVHRLADEALARGAALAQTVENAEVLRLALKTNTEMFAECRERVAQLETALRGLQAALTYPQGSDLNGWVQQCIECHQPAPGHEDDCDMGKATALANAALAAGKP